MLYTLRFAPSVNGRFHVGNLKVALLNFVFARKLGGKLLLRVDDTFCGAISNKIVYGDIIKVFSVFGISFDDIIVQSKRYDIYVKFAKLLCSMHVTYVDCDVVRVNIKGSLLALLSSGVRLYYREFFVWTNVCIENLENVAICSKSMDRFFYNFTSVIDDICLGVDLIIRGEDHVRNTSTQVVLFYLIKFFSKVTTKCLVTPLFFHVPLVKIKGKKLSKRCDDSMFTLDALLSAGIHPLVLTNVLLNFRYKTMPEIIKVIDFSRLKSVSSVTLDELWCVQAKTISKMSFSEMMLYHQRDVRFSEACWDKILRCTCLSISEAIEYYDLILDRICQCDFASVVPLVSEHLSFISLVIMDYKYCLANMDRYYLKFCCTLIRYRILLRKNGPPVCDIVFVFGKYLLIGVFRCMVYSLPKFSL